MAVQGTKTPTKGDRPEEWMVSFPFGMRFPW